MEYNILHKCPRVATPRGINIYCIYIRLYNIEGTRYIYIYYIDALANYANAYYGGFFSTPTIILNIYTPPQSLYICNTHRIII